MSKYLILGLCILFIATGCTQQKHEEAVPEKLNVVITSFGDRKISTIKAVRAVTGLGLKDAKNLVDSTPALVKKGLSRSEAESIALKLREAGANVEIRTE